MKIANPALLRTWVALVGVSLLLNLGTWFGANQYFASDDTTAVLHYSADYGIDFIGDSSHINVLPRLGVLLLSFNLIIGLIIFRVEPRAAWILWGVNPLLQAGLMSALYVIWRINT